MTPEQFAYWFQGFAELSATPPTQKQWDSMREHVATVFKKVTPPVAQPYIGHQPLDLYHQRQHPTIGPLLTDPLQTQTVAC